ncbi:MAG: HIT family protein [Planctomycetes bacterium]|nr:HIT family protein [Planctomycetota bacterium]
MSGTLEDVVRGERPVLEVARDPHHVAFLAERPVRPGHVVVATCAVVDSVLDLDAAAAARLWAFVHELGRRMRARLPCERVCVSVIGWAVRHAHVHLIPTDAAGQVPGLDGEPPPADEMQRIAAVLRG